MTPFRIRTQRALYVFLSLLLSLAAHADKTPVLNCDTPSKEEAKNEVKAKPAFRTNIYRWYNSRGIRPIVSTQPTKKDRDPRSWLAGHIARDPDLTQFERLKGRFSRAIRGLSPEDRSSVRAALKSVGLIDWEHTAYPVIEAFVNPGESRLEDLDIQHRYEEETFEQFRAAHHLLKRLLKAGKSISDLSTLLEVHKEAMKGVDGFRKTRLGKVRDYAVVGDETGEGISPAQRVILEQNPYTSFEKQGRKRRNGNVRGDIVYPEPNTVKPEALERIRLTHPKVFARVQRHRTQHKGEDVENKPLTRALVTALAEERFASFKKDTEELLPLNSVEKVYAYVERVAQHYIDMISIHPLGDGNGRTIRLVALYAPLDLAGISRPRLRDPNLDLLMEPKAFVDLVWDGILNGNRLYADVRTRVGLGLPLTNTPELVYPASPRSIRLDHLFLPSSTKTKPKRREQEHFVQIDPKQFTAYVYTRVEADPKLMDRIYKEPLQTLQALVDDYLVFYRSTHIVLEKPQKKGRKKTRPRLFGIDLADRDFIESFGENWAKVDWKWKYKIRHWYLPELIFQGSAFSEKPSEEEVLAIFRDLGSLIAVGRWGEEWADEVELKEWIAEDLERFNAALLDGTLAQTAHHQIQADDPKDDSVTGYSDSYLFSSSQKKYKAAGYAAGAQTTEDKKMVFADVPGGIVYGFMRARSGVEINSLRALYPEFRSAFATQAEISVPGGVDPDVMMTVQWVDQKTRKIEHTWARNPSRPDEVWLVEGDFDPFTEFFPKEPEGKFLKRVRLFENE